MHQFKYTPDSVYRLVEAVKAEIAIQGNSADLNCIDTSGITDMHNLFMGVRVEGHRRLVGWGLEDFNGDISGWDVSNVTDMSFMFYGSQFEGDVSQWNVQPETNTNHMFRESLCHVPDWYAGRKHQPKTKEELVKCMAAEISLNGNTADLNCIDTSAITDMNYLFSAGSDDFSQFNGDISLWNTGNVKLMSGMFLKSSFNGDISKWDVSSVTDFSFMFRNSSFKGDLDAWKVSGDAYFKDIFDGCECRLPVWYKTGSEEKKTYGEDEGISMKFFLLFILLVFVSPLIVLLISYLRYRFNLY